MIKALLFDLDGTLFDSTEANVKAYGMAFRDVRLRFNESVYRKMFGLRFKEMMDAVAPGTDKATLERIKIIKAQNYQKNLNLVRSNSALISLIKSCKGRYKTALVTTASKQNVTNLLAFFSIDESLFDVIIRGEDVRRGKPDPECYIKAVKELGVKPKECCIFEDSQPGIEAAQRSGAQVIKVSI